MTAILVAEDDPVICDLLTEIFKEEFAATVRCERTGSRALHAIETAGFDLAIIDVNLPEVSGYELARHAINRNIPTLLSSGYPESDYRLKGYECPYLPKPYRIADLLDEAAEAIAHTENNIHRIETSLARLEATPAGLKADVAETRRLNAKRQAIGIDRTPPIPAVPSDAIEDWFAQLSSQPKRLPGKSARQRRAQKSGE